MCSPLTLANDNTLQDLILAIAVKAAQDAQDMMTDMLVEKGYLQQNGLPNKDDFRNFAVGFLVDTYSEQVSEFYGAGDKHNARQPWDSAWGVAVNEVVRRWPELTKLTVDLK
jgi:hypothetical protein